MSDEQTAGDQGGTTHGDVIRASASERAATVDRLKAAHDEGRLTLDEFSDRIAKARDAQTRGELQALVADLPAPAASTSARSGTDAGTGNQSYNVKSPEWRISPLGGWKQRGRWRLDRDINVVSLIGGVDIDLANAEFATNEVTVTSFSLLGGADITAPPNVRVEIEGISLLGGREITAVQPSDPGAPVFRLRAYRIIGGVEVRND